MDLLLTGGQVVDGTGQPPKIADLLIRDGRIAEIGSIPETDRSDLDVRDVDGAVVCPGFLDIHTHSDLTLLSAPTAPSKVHQGVTTEVVGNCGLGVAPLPAGVDVAAMRLLVSYLDLDPAVSWDWSELSGYRAAVADARPSLNVATLTAHLPVRAGVIGLGDRAASQSELDRMGDLLADSFAQGSLGLSTGLVYAPLCFAAPAELLHLGHVVAAHDRVFAWHVRDYADELLDSVRQAIDVSDRTGCRVQISHLVSVGRRNWGGVVRALELIDAARDRGCAIGVDVYPYLFGNAPLSQLLPAWVQDGGAENMARRLHDPQVRERIRTEWVHRPLGWDEITISRVPDDAVESALVGSTIEAIAHASGRDGDEIALDLLAALGTSVLMVAGGRSEDDLGAVLSHPAAVLASDGLALDPHGVTGAGVPHPRSYGCFPRFLARYVGSDPAEFSRAVRQCTSAPAQVVGLADRGVLRPGAPADVVVFRREALRDEATFTQPQLYPRGIDLVLVNGTPVVEGSEHTGARPGRVLEKTSR